MTDSQYPPWPDLLRWLTTVKDRVETLPVLSAEQVVTGEFDPDLIPPIPWDRVLKAGSSLGDLETRSASDLSSGTLPDGRMPALSGDVSSVAGTVATLLATVNSSPGSFGSGTQIPVLTVNEKGLVTAVLNQPIESHALTRVNDTNVTATLTGTPATALLKDVTITLGWQSTLGVTRGGTGTGTTFTEGSVIFAGPSGVYSQDNAGLYFDSANNFLGIGLAGVPGSIIDAHQSAVTMEVAFKNTKAAGQADMYVTLAKGPGGFSNGFRFITGSTEKWVVGTGIVSIDDNFRLYESSSGTAVIRADGAGALATLYLKSGNVFVGGSTSPTARIHLAAGTATANTAPLKLTSGTSLTTAEAGAIEFTTDDYFATITTGAARKAFVLDDGARLTSGKIPVASTNGRLIDGPTLGGAGLKIPAIQASARSTAQTAAVASVATYANGAADASFLVSANVNVTTSTTHNFAVQVDYTDETNTAQTLTLTFSQMTGASVTAITNVTGAGPYEGVPLHVRCKASTNITVKTTGTFTIVTYNVEGLIMQVA